MGRRREASGGTGGVWGLPAPPTLLVTCGPSLRCLEIGSGEMVWENQLRGMGRGEVRMLRGTVPLKQDDGRAIASGGNMAPPSPITPAFSPALGLGLDHGDGQLAGHQPATPASAEPAGYGFEYPTQPQTIDLVFLSVGSRVKAVRAGSGVNVWEAEPVPLKAQAPQQGDAPNQENTQQQFSTVTSLLLQDGALYLGYQCGVVRALDALTGKLIWERNLCSSHAANGGVGAGTDECGETDPTVQGGPRRGSTVSNTGNHIPSPSAQQAPVPLGGHVSLATVRSGDGEHNRSVDGIWGAEGSHC
ncbi:hypothetical protein HK101_011070 [Irineochytrium annulatum]|nr:hypothetical protein HK101_011070 [Irineochytrium annulatum]